MPDLTNLTFTSGGDVSSTVPMSYQDWWNSLSEEEKQKYVASPTGRNVRADAYNGYLASFNAFKSGSSTDPSTGYDITGKDSSSYGSTDFSGFDQSSWALEQQWKMDEVERQFNSAEAAKNRDWQKMMSDTAIQRAVEDIKKAGLNPWLALNGGSFGPASTPSGSSASASSGSSKVPENYLVKMLIALVSSASGILKALG